MHGRIRVGLVFSGGRGEGTTGVNKTPDLYAGREATPGRGAH
jgi:hypothetical protein